jgi:sulfonate transport system permease protein
VSHPPPDTLVREPAAPGSLAESAANPEPARAPLGTEPDPSRRRPKRIQGRGWLRLISPLILLGGWQLASSTGALPAAKMPSPIALVHTTVTLIRTNSPEYGTLQGALATSLERVAIGFAIGATVGVLLAVIAGLGRIGELAVDPIAQALRTVPLFGLIPVFIVWFGIGETPKVALVALAALFPLYLNTFSGIRGIDGKYRELGAVLRLNRREVIRHVVIPGALPNVLVGLRQSLGLAWLALVVAEQINAHAGLGFLITQAQQFLQISVIVVVLLVYCALGLLTDWFVRLIERRTLSWHTGFVTP